MFGLGPMELVIVTMMAGVFLVAPLAAVVILVWMAATGRFSGPKNCPHCGVDLRAPSKQHGQPL